MFWRSMLGAFVCCIACGKVESDTGRSGSGGELANAGGSAAVGGAGQGFQCEDYRACGCKCCEEEPTLECYYPDYGDSFESLVADDIRNKSSPRCEEPIECGPERLYVCCQALPPEGANDATYSGSYSGPDSALVRIEKRDTDGNCAEIVFTRFGRAQRTLASNGLYFMGSGNFAPCGPTANRESVLGISGAVGRRLGGSSCVVDVHVTVFFKHNDVGGGMHAVRFDAEGLDVGLSVGECAF